MQPAGSQRAPLCSSFTDFLFAAAWFRGTGRSPVPYTIYLASESEVGAESAITEMLPLARAPVVGSIVYSLIVLADWLPIRKYFPEGAKARKVGFAGALNVRGHVRIGR